jgi:catechol 2,3-dioxygenase-like lactoylglutathione lyase family enzyme
MSSESAPAGTVSLRWPIWIGVVCDDLEKQRRFYRETLGLSELKTGDGWVWFDFGGRLLELLARSPLPQYDQRRITFAFEVEDIQMARAELIRRGVEPVTPVEGGPASLMYWTYFKDGEGNLFELVQRAVP